MPTKYSDSDAGLLWGLLAQGGHFPDGEEASLLREWFELQRTYPRDGWVGAAQARADHYKKVLACEAKLREFHTRYPYSIHRPELRVGPLGGKPTGKCICGEPITKTTPDTEIDIPNILDWIGQQEAGIARSSQTDATQGALNAFAAMRRKLTSVS